MLGLVPALMLSLCAYNTSPCLPKKQFWEMYKKDLLFEGKREEGDQVEPGTPADITLSYSYKKKPIFAKATVNQKSEKRKISNAFNEASMLEKFQNINAIIHYEFCMYSDYSVVIFLEELGGNLSDRRKVFVQKPLIEQLNLLIVLTDAFEEIHRRGYIHGDIKPRNLVFTKDKKMIKIIDFGYSVMIGAETLGYTEFYSAPELMDFSSMLLATTAQDVWSWMISIMYLLFPQLYHKMRDLPQNKNSIYNRNNLKIIFDALDEESQEWSLCFDTVMKPWVQLDPEKRPTMRAISKGLKKLLRIFKKKIEIQKLAKKLREKKKIEEFLGHSLIQ